jgi:hypothetical protein
MTKEITAIELSGTFTVSAEDAALIEILARLGFKGADEGTGFLITARRLGDLSR